MEQKLYIFLLLLKTPRLTGVVSGAENGAGRRAGAPLVQRPHPHRDVGGGRETRHCLLQVGGRYFYSCACVLSHLFTHNIFYITLFISQKNGCTIRCMDILSISFYRICLQLLHLILMKFRRELHKNLWILRSEERIKPFHLYSCACVYNDCI